MSSPQIDLMLTCTMAHITPEDADKLGEFARKHLDDPETSPHFIMDTGYGYIVWVDAEETYHESGLSESFKAVMAFADRQGVQFIRFDRDALELDGLPTFNW